MFTSKLVMFTLKFTMHNFSHKKHRFSLGFPSKRFILTTYMKTISNFQFSIRDFKMTKFETTLSI